MALVLCTGVHAGLVHTRKLVLESSGHMVVEALNDFEIAKACAEFQFDVIVIGQGGGPEVKRDYMALFRKHSPRAKILEVYSPHEGIILQEADDWLESPALPTQLVHRVSRLAGQKKQVERVRPKELRKSSPG